MEDFEELRSRGVQVASSHFSKISVRSGYRGWLEKTKNSQSNSVAQTLGTNHRPAQYGSPQRNRDQMCLFFRSVLSPNKRSRLWWGFFTDSCLFADALTSVDQTCCESVTGKKRILVVLIHTSGNAKHTIRYLEFGLGGGGGRRGLSGG